MKAEDGATVLRSGETIALSASPLGPRGEALAGTVSFEWSTDDPEVLLLQTGPSSQAGVRALKEGRATVTATFGVLSASITVDVTSSEVTP